MATLTVREAIYYSAFLQLPDSMSKSDKQERAEATIKEMGLQDAIDTRIGGWHVKGLSGGQKRRVSICIVILTRPKLLFLDEPTSGLDSAASYHVMGRIIKVAQQDRRTVVVSIHQPSGEVFELFQNLCLLSLGRMIYFGSVSTANEFFSSNGFPCPPMRNPSDHYLRTINKDFDVNGGPLEKKGSQAGFIAQCIVLTQRSFINMHRDVGYYWFRITTYAALSLCVGTIFYKIGHNYESIQARGSVLMFIATFMTFMAIGGFPSFVEDMKIFTRERLNGHYSVVAFVLGNTFSSIPYLFLVSIVPGAIAYYLVGLQKGTDHVIYFILAFVLGNTFSSIPYLFLVSIVPGAIAYYLVGLQKGTDHVIYFILLLFGCMMLVESLMMVTASIVPNFLLGIITGAWIQGVMILNGGFFRLPHDLPKPIWKYPMFYISFHKYANQGFYKNEFEGLNFPNKVQIGGPSTISGDEILRNVWQVEMGYSKWIDLAIILGMVVVYRLMFWGIIKAQEKFKPMIRAFVAGYAK
ncbi:UNVERIFIED_CONTAM: ABC transporter G family member 11 [Sesamum radiatum]|uniref:ABC transporter G family member 11 n=1 Tax=Sesamum radiatum TaxID=300843 RepID=A0AAW2VRM3_SESRA